MADTDLGTISLDEIPIDDHLEEFFACEDGDNFEELQGVLGFGTTSRHVLATWLPAAFDKWGVKYKKVAGWENRGRPISAGYFDPNGSLTHHTGSKSSASNPAPSLRTVIEGRSDLRGPLCQVSTDYNGLTYIVAAGRANHAGRARAVMGNPSGDGNAMYIGNEVQTNGTQAMPKAQYDAVVRVAAAIADHFRQSSAAKVGLHATTSTAGKWDLGAGDGVSGKVYSITKFRRDVEAVLAAGPKGGGGSVSDPPRTALRPGDSGEDVKILQRKLNQVGAKLTVDGSYGPATEAAVKTFQKNAGLEVDGKAGPLTQAALDKAISATTPTPAGSSASKEFLVLVRATSVGPEVYKTDGFRRQHIGKAQLAAFTKAGLKVTELADAVELEAFGPVEENPAGQK